MSGWKHLSDALPSVSGPGWLDLSEQNVHDLWVVAAEVMPGEPDRQAVIVTMALRLQLCPAALRARAHRVQREAIQ